MAHEAHPEGPRQRHFPPPAGRGKFSYSRLLCVVPMLKLNYNRREKERWTSSLTSQRSNLRTLGWTATQSSSLSSRTLASGRSSLPCSRRAARDPSELILSFVFKWTNWPLGPPPRASHDLYHFEDYPNPCLCFTLLLRARLHPTSTHKLPLPLSFNYFKFSSSKLKEGLKVKA